MVDFTCQLDWAIECTDTWLCIISRCVSKCQAVFKMQVYSSEQNIQKSLVARQFHCSEEEGEDL